MNSITANDRDLTILLTLRDRVPFTFRWMAYSNRIKLPFKILIADGGAEDVVVAETLSDSSNYPDISYQYIRYPYDQSFKEYYAKLAGAISQVDTPFVVLADNDDFFIPSGLKRSVEFLRHHQDYSACRGTIGSCLIRPSVSSDEMDGIYGNDVRFTEQVYSNNSIEQESARQRFEGHLAQYSPTWYEVHRTEELRTWIHSLNDLQISDFYLAELLISGYTVATGKVKRELYPYLIRQMNTPGSEAAKEVDGFDRMLLDTWSDDFKKFVEAIAAAIATQEQMDVEDVRPKVKLAYRAYISPFIVGCLSRRSPASTESGGLAKALIRRLEPNGIARRSLRKLHSFAGSAQNREAQGVALNSIDKSSSYYDAIKPIHEFLSKPDNLRVSASDRVR